MQTSSSLSAAAGLIVPVAPILFFCKYIAFVFPSGHATAFVLVLRCSLFVVPCFVVFCSLFAVYTCKVTRAYVRPYVRFAYIRPNHI